MLTCPNCGSELPESLFKKSKEDTGPVINPIRSEMFGFFIQCFYCKIYDINIWWTGKYESNQSNLTFLLILTILINGMALKFLLQKANP